MHEVSIVRNIVRIVREKMNEIYGKTLPVKKIHVSVGKLTGVVPAALDFAFELVSKDTEFQNAELIVDYRPLKITCGACKKEMELDEPFMFCRECGSFDVEVISGKELNVDSFEIDEEVPAAVPASEIEK